jgi:hypothetical protein
MYLVATNQSLEISLNAVPSTNSQFLAFWDDDDPVTPILSRGVTSGITSGGTAVTLVPAPASGVQRTVKNILFTNQDGATQTFIINSNIGGTLRPIWRGSLRSLESLEWIIGTGWIKRDTNGQVAIDPQQYTYNQTLRDQAHFLAANLTTVTAIATNTVYAQYLGKADKPYLSVTIRCRVTTAPATITWAELAIYKGTPVVGANPGTLTRCGFLDVAASWGTTGQKTNVVTTTGISSGDDLWVVWGTQATTVGQLRGGLADDLQAGYYATIGARPSTSPTIAPTLAGATVVPAWFSWLGT